MGLSRLLFHRIESHGISIDRYCGMETRQAIGSRRFNGSERSVRLMSSPSCTTYGQPPSGSTNALFCSLHGMISSRTLAGGGGRGGQKMRLVGGRKVTGKQEGSCSRVTSSFSPIDRLCARATVNARFRGSSVDFFQRVMLGRAPMHMAEAPLTRVEVWKASERASSFPSVR